MDPSKHHKNALYIALGGILLTLIQKMVRKSYQNTEKEFKEMDQKTVLQIPELQKIINDSKSFDYLLNKNNYFFVEGIVQNIQPKNDSLKSVDKIKDIIYGERQLYDVELHVKQDSSHRTVNNHKDVQIITTPQFILKPLTGEGGSQVIIQDFQHVKVLDGVTNYRCEQQQNDDKTLQKKIIQSQNKPKNDAEFAAAQGIGIQNIQTAIFTIGIKTHEQSITTGARLVVYGRVIFDSSNQIIVLPAPLFFARNKKQILDLWHDDMVGLKIFEVLLIAGVVTCGLFFLQQMKQALFPKRINDENRQQLENQQYFSWW